MLLLLLDVKRLGQAHHVVGSLMEMGPWWRSAAWGLTCVVVSS
jgi:hypothetical protein